jgi:SEFIR domain/NACHT domain
VTKLEHERRQGGQAAPGNRLIRVFVSYAHDSERHKSQVLAFCELLRRNNIDADLDQWNTVPRPDWYPWMIKQVTESDHVIIVASPAYKRVGDGNAASDDHRGVQSEAALLRDLLHGDRQTWTPKLLPVILPGFSIDDIPLFLQPHSATHYPIAELTRSGIDELLQALTGQPSAVRPSVESVPFLPRRPFTYPAGRSEASSGYAALRGATDTAVWTATEDLAQQLGIQWLREEERSQVLAQTMPVRWAVTANAEAVMYGVSWQSIGVAAPQELAGRFEDIADLVAEKVPHRRLVILGGSGAGKTALAIRLVREMIRGRLPGQRVPVLLPMGTWNPSRQRLPDWMAERLAQDHSNLRARVQPVTGRKVTLAAMLVESGRILPVLDGLDTIGEGTRAEAIAAVNSLGPDSPLVMTSLVEPYQEAVRAGERGLSKAAVVELLPLTVAEVQSYLAPGSELGRWRRVFARLGDDADDPLAQTLRTPLMLWLAHTTYARSAADPGELCDRVRFPDRETIEDHLIDRLLPAVYPERPTPASRRDTDEQWTQADARSWLTFLARHLTAAGTHDIAWWQLYRVVPYLGSVWRFLTLFLFGFLIGLIKSAALGAGLALLLGLLGTSRRARKRLGWDGTRVDTPNQLVFSPRRLRGMFRQMLVDASIVLPPFAVGSVLLSLSARGLAFAIAGGIMWLFGFAIFIWVGLRPSRIDPDRELMRSVDLSSAVTPGSALRADRDSALVPAAIVVLFGGLVTMLVRHRYAILWGLAFGLAWIMFSAWARYTAARMLLALRGRLPVRTLTFLRDAADRGALRQVGAVYQFRHPRLRDRLAGGTGGNADAPQVDDP